MRALIVILLVCLAGAAQAAVWHVEKDGSGDFTIIQDAIDAAQPGDTILIGPGRYTETAPLVLPGFTAEAHVGVTVDDLTIQGVDRETVIIGPTTPDFDGLSPKGVLTQVDISRIQVESITFENLVDGIYSVGACSVYDCSFVGCEMGLSAFTDELQVSESAFRFNEDGAFLSSTSGPAVIHECNFTGGISGVIVNGAASCDIVECCFVAVRVAVQYDGSTGAVERSLFEVDVFGLGLLGGSVVELRTSTFSDGQVHVIAETFSECRGADNMFLGSTFRSLWMRANSSCSLSRCDILPASGLAVEAEGYFFDPITLDLENNYWGTVDADEIRAMIHDGYDDPSIHAFVDFEPFEMMSVPTETSSFGRLKALFADDQ